jgi:hypothetical protein
METLAYTIIVVSSILSTYNNRKQLAYYWSSRNYRIILAVAWTIAIAFWGSLFYFELFTTIVVVSIISIAIEGFKLFYNKLYL